MATKTKVTGKHETSGHASGETAHVEFEKNLAASSASET